MAKRKKLLPKEAVPKPVKRRRSFWFLRWFVTLTIWGGLIFAIFVIYFGLQLPPKAKILAQVSPNQQDSSITLLDINKNVMANYGMLHGGAISLNDMPPYVINALLATEDRRFYKHHGIDPLGIIRAAFVNTIKGRIAEGGSTITQQLAKNLFLTNDKTYKRKIKEVAYAIWLDAQLTKEEILTLYLNRVYFGAGTYGINAAAERYYGKSVADLTPPEAAVLIGLLKAPSRLNPIQSPNGARARGRLVLKNLREIEGQLQASKPEPVFFNSGTGKDIWYFRDWVVANVRSILGDVPGNIIVETTLDQNAQRQAVRVIRATINEQGLDKNVSQSAFIRLSPSGGIRAMVGGINYDYSQYNRATQAQRQAGSTFKTFVALAALREGYGLTRQLENSPLTIKNWSPTNYNDQFGAPVSFQNAFTRSLNVPVVRMAQLTGMDAVIKAARSLGITTPLRKDYSTALGSAEVTLSELTSAYATIANGGKMIQPWGIVRIKTKDGKVLYERQGDPGQVIKYGDAMALRSLLYGVVNKPAGTGKNAQIPGKSIYGKTGTSQNFRDAWFIGFIRENNRDSDIGGVWLGNDDNEPMNEVTGGNLAAKVWQRAMQ